MDEPPGSKVSTGISGVYGKLIRSLRGITEKTVDQEPKWRHRGNELTTGYARQW
jgi:hydrogenase small subunit